MKKFTRSSLFCAAALLLSHLAVAQSITGTVLTQPCNNNGSIGVTVSGLTPPINYTYTNWMANQSIVHTGIMSSTDNASGLPGYRIKWWLNPNVWTVTASDGTNSTTTNLTLVPAFNFNDSVLVASCPASSTVQANAIGGTAPYSYVWTNLNNAMVYTSNPSVVSNGQYSLAVTDASGCVVSTATGSSNINVYSTSGIQVNVNGTSANCTNGTATATATGGTPPYSYLWSNGAVSQSISGLSQGLYSCVVTDAIGCQSTGYYYLQQAVSLNFNSTITNATCLQNNGAVTGFVNGGTAPYTFLWNTGATTQNLTGLSGGQYMVQVTDANGCTGTGYGNVNANTPVSVTYTATASSCTSPTGSATLTASGGVLPYTIVWNTFPSPTSGTSIGSKPSGTYSFKVTDANGCIQTGAAFIPPSSTINAYINNNFVVCPATTGNLAVTASGSTPPFTYAWNNGATTSNISGVGLGAYSCTITDAAGCSVIKAASVMQSSPINVGFNATPATCKFNTDGAVIANATGGTAPYSYAWSNGQTAATAVGLGTGNYYVVVTDANGCKNSYSNNQAFVSYNATNTACYCTITGTVYIDGNNNCTRNAGENGVPNIQIHCSGLGYTYTDANGVYSFMAPTGTYTITESIQQIYPLASCQSNNQVVSVTAATNCSSTVDFANNVVVLHDLRIITTNMNFAVPGNVYTQKVIVQNDGSATESNIQLGYTHDGQLNYSNCTPWALGQPNPGTYPNWYRITSGFPSLSPGAASASFIDYNVPTNTPLNTLVNFNDTVSSNAPMGTSWLTDNTPWNNVDNHQTTVIGSYDPNFKEVSPQGSGPMGHIFRKDSVLSYVVHFQNTGTYYAQNIVVVDTLDADLDIKSLRPGYGDHAFKTEVSENGVIRFVFKNINLPWKATFGDAMSSGMFTYSIKLKSSLAAGTQIENKAAIYFDYNEPVITNKTVNTLTVTNNVSINELTAATNGVSLYPNPAGNTFNLAVTSKKAGRGVLRLFDISGKELYTRNIELQAGTNTLAEDTTQLQNGVYFIKIETDEINAGRKLIISK